MNQQTLNRLEGARSHKPYLDALTKTILENNSKTIQENDCQNSNNSELGDPKPTQEGECYGISICFVAGLLAKVDEESWTLLCKARKAYRKSLQSKGRSDEADVLREYALESFRVALDTSPDKESCTLHAYAADFISDQVHRDLEREAMESREYFRDRYFALKEMHGLETYKEVAAMAGISIGTVCAIEQTGVMPQYRTRKRLAQAFGVPIGYFDIKQA